MLSASAEPAANNDKNGFLITPNPATNQFLLQLNNRLKGDTYIQLLDINGRMLKQTRVVKDSELLQKEIIVNELPAGNYLIRVQIEKWVVSKMIVKL